MGKRKIDFIGIGAPRSGTTWLTQCLYEHPEIIFPNKRSNENLHVLDKEQNFFSQSLFRRSYSQKNRYTRGIDWYLNRFDWSESNKIRGEFSVGYFADKKAPQRIKKHFPNIKLLVILRNPVEMVQSAYYHLKALVHTQVPADFDQAVAENKINQLRLNWGLYHQHLKKYFSLFPPKNTNISLFDDVKNDPKKVIQKVYLFLGADPKFIPPSLKIKRHSAVKTRSKMIKKIGYNFLKLLEKLELEKIHNKVGRNRRLYLFYRKLNLIPWQYPLMKSKTKKKLVAYFKDDIEQLEKLLNRDLSAWKK